MHFDVDQYIALPLCKLWWLQNMNILYPGWKSQYLLKSHARIRISLPKIWGMHVDDALSVKLVSIIYATLRQLKHTTILIEGGKTTKSDSKNFWNDCIWYTIYIDTPPAPTVLIILKEVSFNGRSPVFMTTLLD